MIKNVFSNSFSKYIEIKRCAHPILRGKYVNGNDKQICVKNMEPERILQYVMDLRNQVGMKVLPRKKPVLTKVPSVQGEWHERMDLINLPFLVEHQI